MFFEKWWPRFPVLSLFQTSAEFEVLVQDDEKEHFSLLCTLCRTHDLVSDLVLVQLENPGTPTNHKFATERKQIVQKPLSLCYARKNEQPESRGSRGCQTNNCVEAVAPHKHSHHGSTNHSPIFWVPRFIDVPYLVPILILFLVKKNVSSLKLFLSSANKGGCSFGCIPSGKLT